MRAAAVPLPQRICAKSNRTRRLLVHNRIYMLRHLLQRFLFTLPALWLVLTLVFLMIHIVPGDPVEQMLGEGAAPGAAQQLRHTLGLDQSLPTQYGHYCRELFH